MNNTRNFSQELGYLRLLFELIFDEQTNNPENANIFNDNQFAGKDNLLKGKDNKISFYTKKEDK